MSDQPRPRRGRHAEGARNDRRLLDAAREVFAAQGAAASLAAVAERAGLGIASLYRRYGGKTDLLRHLCVLAMEQSVEAASAALAVPDATAALTGYIEACVGFRSGALAPLAGTVPTTPHMWRLGREVRSLQATLVDRAHRDGRLRADVTALDIAWLIEQFSRSAPPTTAPPEARTVHRRLLAIALDGLYTPAPQPLPGPPPTVRHYESRWGQHPGNDAHAPEARVPDESPRDEQPNGEQD